MIVTRAVRQRRELSIILYSCLYWAALLFTYRQRIIRLQSHVSPPFLGTTCHTTGIRPKF